MYGCEKTMNTCASYASVEMKTLIAHPSWLYAKPRVIKMALDIEVGDLPVETELYEAVLLWAKQREDKITIIDRIVQKEEDVKNLSMTRTQLLASVVDVEPLAISSAVVEPDEDDEDEVDQKHSFDKEEKDGEEESISDQVTHTHMSRVIPPVDPHDLQLDLANILQCIRFPMMPPDFLANRVEIDSYIMSIHGMKDMVDMLHFYGYYLCITYL